MPETILIVEDDDEIAQLIALNLEHEGYTCRRVTQGEDVVPSMLDLRPDLVLLDLGLPGIDGLEVCRQLRKDPRTAVASIIMLTARRSPRDRIIGLEAGADDYLYKPFDVDELIARVQTSLRRSRQLRSSSPLTGLPGNFEIESRIDALLADGEPFALLHVDLDGFKAYNDHYGFLRGDRAIVLTSRVVVRGAEEIGGPAAFVGHIGGDDFVVLCDVAAAEGLAERIVEAFDLQVPGLYDAADQAAGYVEVVDRSGVLRRHPLLTVSIGIASTDVRSFVSSAEAAAVAVELKGYAKAVSGSAWRIDRRRVSS